jgi:BlaI family transcriptional regulator, penicillinase repressor
MIRGIGMSNLNQNELETMRILWDAESLKPAEIQERFGWHIENATLRSVLRKLVERNLAARRKQGKAYLYKATKPRRTQFARTMQRMAEVFTGGSKSGLIFELLKREKLTPEELKQLRRLAGEKASQVDES